MTDSTTIQLPTFTDAVDQSWFIEPLGGPTHPRNFLDRFPEEVYNKGPDSHLVRFMYTLLGPAGIGWLRKNLLDARLDVEALGLELFDIERFYGDPFGFGRILGELYDNDPTGLFTRSDWDTIKARDEQYRVRATRFMQGVRLGNSPAGMALIGESGIGQPVDAVENYKYLFDLHSDRPMGLSYYGKTASTDEFIIRPRPTTSRSATQTLALIGNPTGGTFILVFNGHATGEAGGYSYTPTTSTTAAVTLPSATLSVTNTGGFSSSGTVTLGGQTVTYAGLTTNSLTGCTGGVGSFPSGTIVTAPTAMFTSIPWNAPAYQVETALTALKNIGESGVHVTGGPVPSSYIVQFGGILSNQSVPNFTAINSLTGGTNPTIEIATTSGGLDASQELVTVSPELIHNLQTALDYTRPVPTIPSVFDAMGTSIRQDWNTVMSSSEYTEVVRFVTGSRRVNWPAVDSKHWIVAGNEVQAPRVKDDRQQHYVGFHNVPVVTAYSDDALSDPNYENDSSVLESYNSVHIGTFNPQIHIALFRDLTDPYVVYGADRILADYAESLTVTTQVDDTGLINGVYPTDYLTLSGVPQIKYNDDQFWASRERIAGADLIEIDLGSPQAVNFITFEATQKPFDMEVAYDIYDQAPRRHFVSVTPDPIAPWESSLHNDPLEQNPWHYLEFHFTDALGEIPFTRFIRLKFTRRQGTNFLYDPLTATYSPWSVEARNLRVGRNVANA